MCSPRATERIDEVLVLLMLAPRSFTGEDVVEIHRHGGVMAVQRVLERVLAQPGVRRAQPGEFSQRAVLNGRPDLTAPRRPKIRGRARQRAAQRRWRVGMVGAAAHRSAAPTAARPAQ